MQAPIEVHFQDTMGLRDAIAYEFYMDNVKDMIHGAGSDGKNISEAIAKLAASSYIIADAFIAVRNQSIQNENESPSQES